MKPPTARYLYTTLALAIIGLACSSADPAPPPAPPGASAAGLGDPVRDGKFEFTAQKIECGVARLGSADYGQSAQGQFCLITLKIANIGKEAQTFFDSEQRAYSPGGAQFSTDTAAGLHANENADVFIAEINPGNSVVAVIVFDIPATETLTKLELHDSPLSGGVTVTLT